MLDRRTWREFAGLLALGPLLVLLGIGIDQTIGADLARTSGSMLIGGLINLLIILKIVVGSGLAVLGALKITEWTRMPAQRRQGVRSVPLLTTAWMIALLETAVLLSLAMMWMLRTWHQ